MSYIEGIDYPVGGQPPLPKGTIFQQPKNTMPRIESIYAYLSVDAEDGNEGIVGAPFGPVGCLPLVAADETRLKQYEPIVQALANEFKRPIRLVRFTQREEVGFIVPRK